MRFVNAADLDKPALVTLEAGTHFGASAARRRLPVLRRLTQGSAITPLKFEADGKTP